MNNFKWEYRRYTIQAKRVDTNEKWTDWTIVNDYDAAVNHADHIKELGYSSRIVDTGERR